jgi:hypothetical protein
MAASAPSFINLATLLGSSDASLEEMFWQRLAELRVAVPVVVVSFDDVTQTVVVQPAIQENLLQNSIPVPTNLPNLVKVPIGMIRAGGFCITMPIQPGDEGLVVFADMCIDAWWQSGGVANNQVERRRHDLSDGFFLPMFWSQPRVLPNYAASIMQIRNDIGTILISLLDNGISITPDGGTTSLTITAGQISIQAATLSINGAPYATHIHSAVQTGTSDSGPVVP